MSGIETDPVSASHSCTMACLGDGKGRHEITCMLRYVVAVSVVCSVRLLCHHYTYLTAI